MSATGRNDPCPCGSGKRYKHCHGTLGAGSESAAQTAANGDGLASVIVRALATHQRGDLDQAEQAYRSVLLHAPEHAQALHYLGVIAYQRGQLDEAMPFLERSVALAPTEPEFSNNLGLALAALQRDDDAIAAFRATLARNARHAAAWNNLGLSLQAKRAVTDAIAAFREALHIDPGFVRARWNLALALLAVGDYADGWRAYEARLDIPELGGDIPWRPGPRWGGENPSGKRLLVISEQGLGDTLQFARFATPLARRGAEIIVEVPPSLVRIVSSVPGVARVVAKGDNPPPFDAQVPLSSLPYRLEIDDPALAPPPYIAVEQERRSAAASRVAKLRDGRLAVGLAWAGNRAHIMGRLRSPPVDALQPLFDVPHIAWFSLQKGESANDFVAMSAGAALFALEAGTTFDDDAALIDSLDLVISVDTSIAHLAGAMAKPTWVMLPFAADWRWGVNADSTPWYPSARLFRQERTGDWGSVVAAIRAALTARARER